LISFQSLVIYMFFIFLVGIRNPMIQTFLINIHRLDAVFVISSLKILCTNFMHIFGL